MQSVTLYARISVDRLYTAFRQTYEGDFSYAGESHDYWEWSYIISGSCGCTAGEDLYTCHAGDMVLHKPNIFHSVWILEDEPCDMLTVAFNGEGLNGTLLPGKYTADAEEIYSVKRILSELSDLFYSAPDGGVRRHGAPDDGALQMFKGELERILLSLMRRSRKEKGLPEWDEQARCYREISTYLRKNVERPLTLEDICREMYQSPGRVKSIFRRFTGGGVMAYFNHLRIAHVMELLAGGCSVQDIAGRMGFSSPYYLSYFFKRETGMTARDYLRSRRTGD